MNCDEQKCPHGAMMTAAHRACQQCGRVGEACNERECPSLPLLAKARKACLECDHLIPAGKGGTISFDAAGERIINRRRLDIDRSPRGQVTTLPAAQEERLAEVFRHWIELDPLDALLLFHIAKGGTTNTFGPYICLVRDTITEANPLRDNYRATAWNRWQRILRHFPMADKLRSWSSGHGGAKPGQGIGREHKFADKKREKISQQRKEKKRQAEKAKAEQNQSRHIQQCQTLLDRFRQSQKNYVKIAMEIERASLVSADGVMA